MNTKWVLAFVFLIFLTGCSGIKMIGTSPEKLYRPEFTAEVSAAKQLYGAGKPDQALEMLKKQDDKKLLPIEKSFKYNLVGVIYFSKKNYPVALTHFETALQNSALDESLTAQIHLNIASAYYKQAVWQKALTSLSLCDYLKLKLQDQEYYHLMTFELAKKLGRDDLIVPSLLSYLLKYKRLSQLRADNTLSPLTEKFFAEPEKKRLRLLEDRVALVEKESIDGGIILFYMAFLQGQRFINENRKDAANELFDWIKDKGSRFDEIITLLSTVKTSEEYSQQIASKKIGIVLPLSGDRQEFGERVLVGVDFAIKSLHGAGYELLIRDSRGTTAGGAFQVKELIEKEHVALVIGGLFSDEAQREYEEARKFGTFFISLAQVYLPAMAKNHLLLEIPGSTESQIQTVLSDDVLKEFGKKGAIIFPDDDRGFSYVNSFWETAQKKGVEIVDAQSFSKSTEDYRKPVRALLGLEHPRERKEEQDLLADIQQLEKTKLRRTQTLNPIVDFDWVFIPTVPKEALQIIPSFSYYDASNVTMIGDPSWRTQMLVDQTAKQGALYFVSDDVPENDSAFVKSFAEAYKIAPRPLEIRGYDGARVAFQMLNDSSYSNRDKFESALKLKGSVAGISGAFTLESNLWIKKMHTLKIKRGAISPLNN